MSEEKKDGTKNVPPPTNGEGRDRITAETIVVAEGDVGLERTRRLTRLILQRSDEHDSGDVS
jgi:hypothetical protein